MKGFENEKSEERVTDSGFQHHTILANALKKNKGVHEQMNDLEACLGVVPFSFGTSISIKTRPQLTTLHCALFFKDRLAKTST